MVTRSFRHSHSLLFPVFLLLLLCAACGSGTGLKIIGHLLTVREFTGDLNSTRSMAIVSGMAGNTSKVPISKPVIEVTFYDDQKNIIGSASTSREFLEPAETWNFTVQLTTPDAWKVRSYEINSSNQ